MTQREKDQYTREAILAEIARIEKKFANFVINNIGKDVSLNTQDLHQEFGALKALKGVLYI